MTAKQAYHKLSVMLGLTETAFAEAILIDGTVVKTEGELVEGTALMVVTPEGEIPAPAGIHETQESMIITVDEAGIIVKIEEKEAEAEPTVEVEVEAEAEETFSIEGVVNAIQPLVDQVTALKAELEAHKAEFSAFKGEPAAQPIKNNFKKVEESNTNARIEFLSSLRKKTK
jgi:hypothetical protein